MFIARKVVVKLRYILSSVHCRDSCCKVAVCIIKCSLQGKFFKSCGVYYKVFMTRTVVSKLRYVLSSVHCKESCFNVRYVLSCVHCRESWFKVAVDIIKCPLQGKLF